MSIYYVYAYLRSRNSTIASKGTPYYIGKGSNGRAWHKNHGSIHLPPDKSNIVILEPNLSENKAFEIEKFLIAYHGRIDQGTGVLRNRTNGGEGGSGLSKETKAKMSAIWKTRTKKEIIKITSGMKGKHHSIEAKTKIANAVKNMSNETRIKKSIAAKNQIRLPVSDEAKLKMSAAKKTLPVVQCPHCGKRGKGGAMIQWHFDNCKLVSTVGIEPTTPCSSRRCSTS